MRSVGVEEEFVLLRPDGALAEVGGAVAQAAGRVDDDGQFEAELKRAQVELASEPAEDLAALGADLRRLRGALAAAAADDGARLIASGTSPTSLHPRTTRADRYERMTDRFALLAREQLTCGMHIHVSIDSAEEGVAVLDRIGPDLAVLAALSSNSPLYGGTDTGYASYRSVLWGRWPTAGPTGAFGDRETYERLKADLIASGAALDDGMIYFDARLSDKYPTVEIRVADVCADVRDSPIVAAVARGMVETAARQWRQGRPAHLPRVEMLRSAGWRAARWGMTGDLVEFGAGRGGSDGLVRPAWQRVDELVRRLAPALEDTGDIDLIRRGLDRIHNGGTGAQRQRKAFGRGGMSAVLDLLECHPE